MDNFHTFIKSSLLIFWFLSSEKIDESSENKSCFSLKVLRKSILVIFYACCSSYKYTVQNVNYLTLVHASKIFLVYVSRQTGVQK